MSTMNVRIASLLLGVALVFSAAYSPRASADAGNPGLNLGQVEVGTRDASALRQSSGPIVYATGNLVAPVTDFSGQGEMALYLTRTFNNYWGGVGIFGAKWQSNFDYKLSFNSSSATSSCYPKPGGVCATSPTGTTSLTLWAHLPDGRRIKYAYDTTQNKWLEHRSSAASTVSYISYIVRNGDGSYTLHNDHQGVENYSAKGYVMSIADAQNVGWTFAYDASNYLQTVTHTNGRKVTFTWTGNQLTKVTGPTGNSSVANVHSYSYTANALGSGLNLLNMSTGISAAGFTSYTYYVYGDSRFPGALTRIVHDNDDFANYAYDANGFASTMTLGADGVHSVFTFTYTPGANSSVSSVVETNPLGRNTTYAFTNGLVTSTSGTGGANTPNASKTHTYDANGYDYQVTDFNGNLTVYTYAANGQLQNVVEASGQPEARTTQYTWDTTPGTNRLTKVVVPGDHETDYTYDPATQRVATVSQINLTANGVAGQSHLTTYTYTNNTTNGILQRMLVNGPVSGNSDQVIYGYSANGDLISIKNNLGQTTTYSGYNALGEVGTVTGPNGDATVYTYSTQGQVTNVQTSPNGVTANTTYKYTGSGQLASVTTPDGVTENYVYNDSRHLIAKYRAANGTVAGVSGTDGVEEEDYIYSAADEVVEIDDTARNGKWGLVCTQWYTSSEGIKECSVEVYQFTGTSTITSKSFRSYDGLGRLWTATGNNGQKFTNGYDFNGNLISTTDSLTHVTTYVYDHLNRKIGSVDATHGFTTIGYDAGNRVTSVVDPRFLVTSYVYDGFGQLWAQSSPDTGTVSFTYDAYGRRTGFTRADNNPTAYTFDGLNRIATVTAGGQTQTFAYDSCTNGVGRVCSVVDTLNGATDSLTTTYTPEGWVASQSSIVAGSTYNTSYTYDSMGRTTGVTYPNGVAANYAYTGGKLASTTVTINGVTSNVATGLTYQPYAGAAGWTYGNGLVRGNNYDLDGRLTGISTTDSSTVVQSLTFGYDANNSIKAITNGVYSSLTQTYGYDELLRLTGQSTPSHATTWGYDADSNRSSQLLDGSSSTTYNLSPANNELNGLTGASNRTYGYDPNGNRTSDSVGNATYHYDPFNRMDSSVKSGVTTSYHVDPLGRRVFKSGASGWTHFVYAADGQLLSDNVSDNTSAVKTDYVWMGGALVGMVRNNALYMVHTDQVGRPDSVTNSAKAVVWRANNLAFSRTVALDTIGGLNIGFPGQYYDAETGLWNNGYRDYDATTGRYIESDPLGLNAGINTFTYVDGNPILWIDPLGLKSGAACANGMLGSGGFGGMIGGVVGGLIGSLGTPVGTAFGIAIGTSIGAAIGGGVAAGGSACKNDDPNNGNTNGGNTNSGSTDGKSGADANGAGSGSNNTSGGATNLPGVTVTAPYAGDSILTSGGSAFAGTVTYAELMAAYPSPPLNDGRIRAS